MASVTIDPETNAATITLANPVETSRTLQISLKDLKLNRYLTANGWSNSRRALLETVSDDGSLSLVLTPETADRISAGAALLVEEFKSNFREKLTWPKPQPKPVAIIPAAPAPVEDTSPAIPQEPITETRDEVDASGTSPPQRSPILIVAAVCVLLVVALLTGYGVSSWTAADAAPSPALADRNADLLKEVQRQAGQIASLQTELDAERAREAPGTDNQASETINRLGDALKEARVELARLKEAQKTSEATVADLRRRLGHNQPASASAGSREADLIVAKIVLEKQLSDARIDGANHEARVLEQERIIRELRQALAAAQSNDVERQDRIDHLEKELAQRIIGSQGGPGDEAVWLAAAVDLNGAVDTAAFQSTRKAAEALALQNCGGSASGCRLIGSYENACFALSRPTGQAVKHNWWHAADKTWQEAERRSLYECRRGSRANSCTIRISVCSPSGLSKP